MPDLTAILTSAIEHAPGTVVAAYYQNVPGKDSRLGCRGTG